MNNNNNSDMLDIQDKMGYVDTGPRLQQSTSNHTNNYPVATSTSAHLVIKEPKPQRKVNLMNEQPQRPMTNEIKKKQSTPNIQPKPPSTERPEKNTRVTYENSENRQQQQQQQQQQQETRQNKRVDIKKLMVHKLYELADMLQSLDVDEPYQNNGLRPTPTPTPSKSDPQQQIKRRPNQRGGRNQSPEMMSREVFNKSADYIEPIYHRRPYYGYYDHPLPPQEVIYNDSNNDDAYYPGEEPYNYYHQPPLPPPQQNYLRRRSYSNLRDIEPQPTRLIRKGSRNNTRFLPVPPPPPPQQQRAQYESTHYDPRYDSYQEIPNTGRYHRSSYYPPYSPDEYY